MNFILVPGYLAYIKLIVDTIKRHSITEIEPLSPCYDVQFCFMQLMCVAPVSVKRRCGQNVGGIGEMGHGVGHGLFTPETSKDSLVSG